MSRNQNQNETDTKRSSVDTAMELLHLLRSSMANTLTSHQYQVFALHFLEGIPQNEIANEFGLSLSAVSKCYSSTTVSLREYWKTENGRTVKHKILDCLEDVLTDKQFQAFCWVFFSGGQQKDIAAENGLSRSAISRTYNSGLNRLRWLWIGEEVDSS